MGGGDLQGREEREWEEADSICSASAAVTKVIGPSGVSWTGILFLEEGGDDMEREEGEGDGEDDL